MGDAELDGHPPGLPQSHPLAGRTLARRTPEFTEVTAPGGLRAAHRVASGVWGRLVVLVGDIEFVFEDAADRPQTVRAGGEVVIPPERAHHLAFPGPARFFVEFFR